MSFSKEKARNKDASEFSVFCYNEEVLPLFKLEADRVAEQLKKEYQAEAEYIFIDDGSKDKTLEIIKNFHNEDERVRFISFSRNFGKEAGLYAGLQSARGDLIATLDADLQDPPALLVEMVADVVSGEYDCVATRRSTKKGEPKIRNWFAKLFYKLINHSSDTEIMDGARDFRLMTRQMVNAILEMSEYNRFFKSIFCWVSFKTKWISYENVERAAGNTKWNFWSLFLSFGSFSLSCEDWPMAIRFKVGHLLFVFCYFARESNYLELESLANI